VVVRPSTKREKKKKKRLADPTRRSYGNILQLSEQRGSGLFNTRVKSDSNIDKRPDEEAAAVAEAVGLPSSFRHVHSTSDSKLSSGSNEEAAGKANDDTDTNTERGEVSPSALDGENEVVLKSPGIPDLDSPPESESESESESEEDADANTHKEEEQKASPDIAPDTTALTTESIEPSKDAGTGEEGG
jgi:hypothetical protein